MSSELRIFVPTAIRALIDRLTPRIEAAAETSLMQWIDLNPAIPERIAAGEAFDIALTNPHYVKALVADGHVDGSSHRPFGRVPLAAGRKAGAGSMIRTEAQEIVELFRAAGSIAYTGSGTSGRTYLEAVERLGLTDVLSKSLAMGGGVPVASVVAGEAELAVGPLTTILSTPGVAPAAVFPEELGTQIDMSVFLSTTPRVGAVIVLDLLTASELDAELAAAGVMRFEFT